MKNIVNSYVRKFKEERRERWKAAGVLLALALVVIAAVSWQLHSTGIAQTNETYCGLEEHTHSADCYEQVLVCGLEESEGHTHTEDCYEEQLTCGLEEHTHTVECLSDETADVETASDWAATIPDLTGETADDVVAIAKSQLGYTESTKNFILAEDGETRKGYTRYGAWYGDGFEYVDWDAMFASFCLSYAGISTEDFPQSTGAYAWAVKLQDQELYADAADYTPEAGDLVFFDTDGDGKIDTVGIVEKLDTEEAAATATDAAENESNSAEDDETALVLYVIEGNYAAAEEDTDAVCEVIYGLDDETIAGYGMLPEQTESEALLTVSAASLTATEDGATDLEDYIGESGSITVSILNEDRTSVETSEDGVIYLVADTTYRISLIISVPKGLASGTYTYDGLKDYADVINFTGGSSGSITNTSSGSEIGTWKIDEEGLITLTMTDSNTSQNLSIGFSISVTFTETTETKKFGDSYIYVNGSVTLNVSKTGTRQTDVSFSDNDDDDYIRWDVVFSGLTTVAGTVIYDNLYQTGSASNNPDGTHWIDTTCISQGVTFVATESDGTTTHTWTVKEDDGLGWKDQDGDNTMDSWTYTMPASIYCEDCKTTITLSPEWTYTASYYTYREKPSETVPNIMYRNNVKVTDPDDTEMESNWTLEDFYGGYYAVKEYSYGDDNLSVVWKTTFHIPANAANGYSFVIQDIMTISPNANAESNDVAELLTSDFISSDVTITVKEGDTVYTAAPVDSANADDKYVYTVALISNTTKALDKNLESKTESSTQVKNVYFCINKRCTCDDGCSQCSNSCSSGEYCSCWTEDTTITITYETDKDIMTTLMSSSYAEAADYLKNFAALYYYPGTDWKSHTTDSERLTYSQTYVPLLLASKEVSKDIDEKKGDYTVDYAIVLNEAHVSLAESGKTLTIQDTATGTSTQALLSETLVIVSTPKQGESTTLTDGIDYTYTFDSDNGLTIILNDPGTNMYTITYTMQIINPEPGNTYGNSVEVSWYDKSVESSVDLKSVTDAASTATTYLFYIHKTNENGDESLGEAKFMLYQYVDGVNDVALLTEEKETDSAGLITFQTIAGELTFDEHTLYYLVETEAPDGYVLDTTKHYFYFCSEGGEDCSECTDLLDKYKDLDVTTANYLANGGTITVKNARAYELPSTGGVGAVPYAAVGLALTGGAGMMLYRRRKKYRVWKN